MLFRSLVNSVRRNLVERSPGRRREFIVWIHRYPKICECEDCGRMHCDNYTGDPDYVDCDIDDRVYR